METAQDRATKVGNWRVN